LRVPVDWDPVTGIDPDQAPDAVQEVALVEDQVSEEALPVVIELGLAARVTVGAALLTETVADC
jgi:hypothetical protein